jgi:hypothetical protein
VIWGCVQISCHYSVTTLTFMYEQEDNVPWIKCPSTAEWENTVLQCRFLFIICHIYNYTSLFQNECLKGLYRHKGMWSLIVVKIITNKVQFILLTV